MLGLIHSVGAPDRLENRTVRENPVGTTCEDGQQLELFGRQSNLIVASLNAVAIVVYEAWRQNGFAGMSS